MGQLAGCGENAQCDGQVETAAFLGYVGGSHVDRDPLHGEFEVTVEQRTTHPILTLLDGGFGQSDDVQRGQAIGDVHLDRDQRSGNPLSAPRVNDGERHAALGGDQR